ncbi:MAG TPA: glycosyltransferase family 1 protein [Chroococcidiopsis sp.]
MNSILCIIPRLPPAIDGVGDYGLQLARQLQRDWGIKTQFIVADPTWQGLSTVDGCEAIALSQQTPAALISALNVAATASVTPTVLLHYVGYGYAQRGCPTWLVDGLERWRSQTPKARLVTMFHELYASGPVWTSAFWLSLVQQQLATRLAKLSDRALTSTEIVTPILQRMVGPQQQTTVSTLPVFSTVGELAQPRPLAERPRRLVVFGSSGVRRRVYQSGYGALSAAAKSLEIETIYDIGAPTGLEIDHVDGVPIVKLGKCSAAEVSHRLQQAIAGFLDYPPALLAKSTIFAAYAAHGVIPIVHTATPSVRIDGLEAGKHYWVVTPSAAASLAASLATSRAASPESTPGLNQSTGEAIAYQAHQWYQTHALPTQAALFATHLVPQLCPATFRMDTVSTPPSPPIPSNW